MSDCEALLTRLGSLLSAEPSPPPDTLAPLRKSLVELDAELQRRLLPTMPAQLRQELDEAYARLDALDAQASGVAALGAARAEDAKEPDGVAKDGSFPKKDGSAGDGDGDGDGGGGDAGGTGVGGEGSGGEGALPTQPSMSQLLEIADLQADVNELTLRLKRQVLSTADIRLSHGEGGGSRSSMASSTAAGGAKVRFQGSLHSVASDVGEVDVGEGDVGEAAAPRPSAGLFGRMFSFLGSGRISQFTRSGGLSSRGSKHQAPNSAKLKVKQWPAVKPPPPPPGSAPQKPIEPHSRGFFYHIFGGIV